MISPTAVEQFNTRRMSRESRVISSAFTLSCSADNLPSPPGRGSTPKAAMTAARHSGVSDGSLSTHEMPGSTSGDRRRTRERPVARFAPSESNLQEVRVFTSIWPLCHFT